MQRLQRDYFFEFAGMPKAGKTTLMETVAHFLQRIGYSIEGYHGDSRYSSIKMSPIADLNISLACNVVNFTITAISLEKSEHKIYLLDKGLIDRCIFTDTLVRRGKVNIEDAEKLKAFLMLPRLLKKLDGVFILMTSPRIALKREYGEMLPQPGREVMNADFLSDMYSIVLDDYQGQLSSRINNVRVIRTDKENEQETVAHVLKNILSIIDADILI
jgi:thymidylate kinase